MPVVAKPVPMVDWAALQQRWSHLEYVDLRGGGEQVDILLGLHPTYLSAAIESRIGGDDEPVAFKTRLGWFVRDVMGLDAEVQPARIQSAFCVTSKFREGEIAWAADIQAYSVASD